MQYIADAKEAKEIDGISIQKIGIPSFVLMERASLKVAGCVRTFADKERDFVLVVCGMGNNGGDGVAAARILAEDGFAVRIALLGSEEKASAEMKRQLEIARNLSIPFITGDDLSEYTVIIDAVFGIGLSREITGEYAAWIDRINQTEAMVVAVDIPSGVDASNGRILGTAIRADYTVTFGVNKRGLVLFPGAEYAGKVLVEDIGFPKKAVEEVLPKAVSYEKEDLPSLFPKRKVRSNKGSYGKVLVIAGSAQMSGAAYFAAAAAYRMGSGLVKVVTHQNNRIMLQTKLPEALLCTYDEAGFCDSVCDTAYDKDGAGKMAGGEETERFVSRLQKEIEWATTIVIGPGLGISETAKLLLRRVLQVRDIPVVIDADGLNLLAGDREYFTEKQAVCLPENFVLTPHLKEMSRLTGEPVKHIQETIVETACEHTTGAVVVLKDARTVVTDGKRIVLNQSGNNALAKGGSGDVLSGVIGGLLALGKRPFEAAALGVYLHGLTAEEYVKKRGAASMFASDILEELKNLQH